MDIQDTSESSDSDSEYELVHRTDAEEKPSSSVASWKWRNILVMIFLWIAYFICNMAYSIISPFFPEEAQRYSVSSIFVGVIISCSPLTVAITSPLFGYLLPRIGVWPMIFMGLLLVGSSFTSLGFLSYIPTTKGWIFGFLCVLLRGIEGVGTAMYFTSTFSIIPRLFPNSVSTIMGFFEVGCGVSYSLGPLLGGFLYQYGGFKLPFISVGVSLFFFTLPCTFLARKISVESSKRESLPLKYIFRLFTDLTFITLGLVFTMVYSAMGFYAPSLQLFLTDEFHINAIQIGAVYFISSMSYGIFSLFIGTLADKLGQRSFIIFGVIVTGLIHFGIGVQYITKFTNLWIIRAALFVNGLGISSASIPLYTQMLKITKRYKIEDDKDNAVAAIVSGWISCSINIGLNS